MVKKESQNLKIKKSPLPETEKNKLLADLQKDDSAEHRFKANVDDPIVIGGAEHVKACKSALNLRQISAGLREKSSELRRGITHMVSAMTTPLLKAADERENIADQREAVADRREEAATAIVVHSSVSQALLKAANERLVLALIHAQTVAESAQQANVRMSYEASHDYLTGLPNRSLLKDRMAQSIAFAKRHGKKVALMFMDLDHFKHINDSHGHAVGDELLKSVAERLQTCIRHSDTLSRQGGDEFIVLLNGIEETYDAVVTAEKIIDAMRLPHSINDKQLCVTFSIGISIYPDDGNDLEMVAKNADAAMYVAKEEGRNAFRIFSEGMQDRVFSRQYGKGEHSTESPRVF